jgi:hypothetical protein
MVQGEGGPISEPKFLIFCQMLEKHVIKYGNINGNAYLLMADKEKLYVCGSSRNARARNESNE